MKDGHLNKCKDCTKTDVTKNRHKNIEYFRAYDRQRGSRQTVEQVKKRRSVNPEKYKANSSVGNAVRDRRLFKPDIYSMCGMKPTRLHGHHEDYSKPLEVIWVCSICHKKLHSKRRGNYGSYTRKQETH